MTISQEKFKNTADDIFKAFGLKEWGVCPFSAVKENLLDCRKKGELPENSETVISFLFPYLLEEYPEKMNISRYAAVPDYHRVTADILSAVCERLKSRFPENKFVFFSDNSPVPEVRAAALSGLGKVGKHTLLLNEKYGSWVFIGEIVTDLGVKIDNFTAEIPECSGCNMCVKACPGGAIGKKGGISEEKCLSAITQRKGELTKEEEEAIRKSGCMWGCDICQKVCPENAYAAVSPLNPFKENQIFFVTDETPIKNRPFGWRGRGVIRRNFQLISDKNNNK